MQAPDPATKLGKHFAIFAWLLLLGVLYLFFDEQIAEQLNPNRKLQSSQQQQQVIVTMQANKQGHFVGTLLLNGKPIDFLLDTGATMVAVSDEVAAQTGMKKGIVYETSTANGVTTAYQSKINELRLGDIVLHDLEASIVPNLDGTEILLGMSALKHLEFSKREHQLQLIQHKSE
jgi:aspartyl protease family protein